MKLEIGDLVRRGATDTDGRVGFLVGVRDRTVRVMWTDGSESHWLYNELEKIASREENVNV
jgi:hypothetical protein